MKIFFVAEYYKINDNDEYIGKSLKEYGEWFEGEIHLLTQICKKREKIKIGTGEGIRTHDYQIRNLIFFPTEPWAQLTN